MNVLRELENREEKKNKKSENEVKPHYIVYFEDPFGGLAFVLIKHCITSSKWTGLDLNS